MLSRVESLSRKQLEPLVLSFFFPRNHFEILRLSELVVTYNLAAQIQS